jgi:hypothetical protein
MLASEALARRSVGVMSKETKVEDCKRSATKGPKKGHEQKRDCPRLADPSAKNSAGGDNRGFC